MISSLPKRRLSKLRKSVLMKAGSVGMTIVKPSMRAPGPSSLLAATASSVPVRSMIVEAEPAVERSVTALPRRARVASYPFMRGICMSMRMRSNCLSDAILIALLPDDGGSVSLRS